MPEASSSPPRSHLRRRAALAEDMSADVSAYNQAVEAKEDMSADVSAYNQAVEAGAVEASAH